jgi:hypothetical protein
MRLKENCVGRKIYDLRFCKTSLENILSDTYLARYAVDMKRSVC